MKTLSMTLLAIFAALLSASPLTAQTTTPSIDHAPVKVAVRGQNILFRAKVTPASKPIEAVTLHYAVSRDAAPYKVPMTPAGSGIYTGTVSADLTAGLPQLLYYIEARDTIGTTAETPWHSVEIKTGAPVPSTATPPKTNQQDSSVTESSWKKPALIAGGALAAGGAALAIMGGGGGGGGDEGGTGTTTTNTAGTYSGTASVFFQPPSGSPSGSTYPITITISPGGTVSSDTLASGSRIEGQLSGVNFLLVAPVNEAGRTGEIQFAGVVINNRITGTVQGSATTPDGNGTYSGGFSAAK